MLRDPGVLDSDSCGCVVRCFVLQEYPNMSTGWWPQRTIRKMRAMSLEGIHECVKLKKQNFLASKAAAAAAAAASAPSASAAGKVVKPPAEVNESLNISGNPLAVGEGEVAGSPSANPAIHAEINAESLKSSETISKQPQQPQQHQEQTKGVYEANSTAPRRPAEQKMPANLSRRDFLKMASRMEDAVEVVPSLPPEPTQGRSQGLAGHGSRRVVGKPGSGGRSGTGRIVTGGVLAAKGGGRVGGIQRRKKEGSTMTHNGDDELELVMKEADAEMVGTSNDEDEKDHDSESDVRCAAEVDDSVSMCWGVLCLVFALMNLSFIRKENGHAKTFERAREDFTHFAVVCLGYPGHRNMLTGSNFCSANACHNILRQTVSITRIALPRLFHCKYSADKARPY